MLVKMKLFSRDEIPVDLTNTFLPARGRRFYLGVQPTPTVFKEILIKTQVDMKSLRAAVVAKLKITDEKLKTCYMLSSEKRLIELEEDRHVEELFEDQFIVVDIAE